MTTENVIAFVIAFGAAGLLSWLMILVGEDQYRKGYKQGQIDAATGKSKYVLVEFEDGTREYVKETNLPHLKVTYEII